MEIATMFNYMTDKARQGLRWSIVTVKAILRHHARTLVIAAILALGAVPATATARSAQLPGDPAMLDMQDPNHDEAPMPVIEEDPFGNVEIAMDRIDEVRGVAPGDACGSGLAMTMPMMMLGLIATGVSRRYVASPGHDTKLT